MKKTILNILVLGTLLATLSYSNETITIKNENLYPEGITYDKTHNHFFISSVSKGEIWTVNEKGENQLFAKNKNFPSTIGLNIDAKNNRLLVCISDPGVGLNTNPKTQGKLAALATYDLSTKKQIAYYDLGKENNGSHFSNDVTYDADGNIYITDSFSPNIYKVDIKGNISLFAQSEQWQVKKGEFGLNGIVYHPEGYLIVAHYATHSLYKIDIKTPNSLHKISFTQSNLSEKQKLNGIDGLNLINNTTIALVSNSFAGNAGNGIYKLTSLDHWKHADIVGIMETNATFPTTLTQKGENIFVIHSKLPELFSGNKNPKVSFEIEQVKFKEIH